MNDGALPPARAEPIRVTAPADVGVASAPGRIGEPLTTAASRDYEEVGVTGEAGRAYLEHPEKPQPHGEGARR
jgi:hypothetical protein